MIAERSAGAVAFRGDPPALLMIHDSYGRWTFPKGLVEPGEAERDAALRELAEETGISGQILAELGVVRYFYTRPDKQIVRKEVAFYLVRADEGEARAQPDEIREVCWVDADQARERLAYRNMQPMLGRAIRTLRALERGRKDRVEGDG